MLDGLYISAAGLQVQEYRQSVMANNLANAQTTGFKRDLALVMSRQNASREDPRMMPFRLPVSGDQGGGVWAAPTAVDLSQATLEQTGRSLDVAIDGPGFLLVEGSTPGQRMLTRDGRLATRADGMLVTAAEGKVIVGATGQPVRINPSLPVVISRHGEISQEGTVVGQLAIMSADSKDLRKIGGGLLAATREGALRPATTATQVRQGHLETSGVDPMVEMVAMMEGQRAFDANAKMIQYQDQTLQLLNSVGRIA